MSRLLPLLVILTFAASLAHEGTAAEPAAAVPVKDAWPSFRNGPQQLGVAHGKLPEKLELRWTFKAGDKDAMIASTAAIVDGRAYVASLNGSIVCLNLKTAEKFWSYKTKENVDSKTFLPGFKAAPTVTAKAVYIGDEEGMFHAIDRETGKKRWTFEAGAEIIGAATPYEDKIIFGSYDSSLYCLKEDGTKVWQYTTQDRINASPAISGHHTFVAGCDARLRVVDITDGKEQANIDLGSHIIASPAVIGDILYVGNYAAEVLAINWKTGKRVWTYTDPDKQFPYHSSPAVTDKHVFIGGQDKRLHCIDRMTGKKVWTFTARKHINSSPVVVGDRIYVGSDDGVLYGLNMQGKEIWRFTDGRPFSASPAVAEGCLIIGSESDQGLVYCFGAK